MLPSLVQVKEWNGTQWGNFLFDQGHMDEATLSLIEENAQYQEDKKWWEASKINESIFRFALFQPASVLHRVLRAGCPLPSVLEDGMRAMDKVAQTEGFVDEALKKMSVLLYHNAPSDIYHPFKLTTWYGFWLIQEAKRWDDSFLGVWKKSVRSEKDLFSVEEFWEVPEIGKALIWEKMCNCGEYTWNRPIGLKGDDSSPLEWLENKELKKDLLDHFLNNNIIPATRKENHWKETRF